MNNEFTKIKSGNYVRYVLEDGGSGGATSGATSAGSISSMDTPIGKDQIVVQSRMGPKEPPKPRNFVAKNAKMGGAGQHKDKKKAEKQGDVKHRKPFAEQGVAEGFNGEYDDEAGMAQSNLLTTARAVMGLLKTIKDRDNLPEWGQEKIAKAEMMLVSVWDYLQSQKEMGNDPQVEGYGRYDRRDAYQRDYDHSVAGMDRGNNHRDDERHDLDPSDWYIVKDGKMYKVSVYPNQEQEAISRGYSPTRDEAKARAGEQGVAEGSYNDYLAGMLENVLGERSKSKAQWDLMHAVAHNPQFANQVKIKPSVGQEFSAADAGHERSALPDRVLKKNKK